jgi:hypothetical protein
MSTDFIPNRFSLFHGAISMACSQVHLWSCGGGRWVRMKRTPLSPNSAIWGTHWMPTPPQGQAGALALAREADPRSGLRYGLPCRRPPHEGHAQVYSLSLAQMPGAQAPTTAAAALDDDVGMELPSSSAPGLS